MARRNTIEVIIKGEDDASGAFKRVSSSLDGLGDAANQALAPVSKFGSFMRDTFSTAAGMLMADAVGAVTSRLADFGRAMIDTNADMETFASQFTTLLGSAEAAEERLASLTDFAKKTPFDLPGVIEANRMLTVFGEGVLDTEKYMTLIGDAAAGANTNFAELSTWVGRAYSAIQAGKPFGEASARLQELGLLTGEQRALLEDMTAAGADSTEVWGVLTDALSKFSGEMANQSSTFKGIQSNIEDTWEALTRTIGKPIFDFAKEGAESFLGFLESDFAQEGAQRIAEFIEGALTGFKELRSTIGEAIGELASETENFFSALQVGNIRDIAGTFTHLATGIIDVTASLLGLEPPIKRFGTEYSVGLSRFADAVESAFKFIQNNGETIRAIFEAVGKAILTLITVSKGISIITGAVTLLAGALSPINAIILALSAAFFAWDQNLFGIRDTLTQLANTINNIFGPAIQEIFDSLSAGNLEGAAQGFKNLFSQIGAFVEQGIAQVKPKLEEFANAFVRDIVPQIPVVIARLGELLSGILNWVVQANFAIQQEVVRWAGAFIEWIEPQIPAILREMLRITNAVVDWIIKSAGEFLHTLGQWVQAFLPWVGEVLRDLLPRLGKMLGDIADFLISEGIPAVIGWIGSAAKMLAKELPDILKAFVKFIANDFVPAAFQAGRDIVDGIVRGLGKLGQKIVDEVQKGLDDFRRNWNRFFGPNGPVQQAIRNFVAAVLDMLADMIDQSFGFLRDLGVNLDGLTGDVRRTADTLRAEANKMASAYETESKRISAASGRTVSDVVANIRNLFPAFAEASNAYGSFASSAESASNRASNAARQSAAAINNANRSITPPLNQVGFGYGNYANAATSAANKAANASRQSASSINNALRTIPPNLNNIGSGFGSLANNAGRSLGSVLGAAQQAQQGVQNVAGAAQQAAQIAQQAMQMTTNVTTNVQTSVNVNINTRELAIKLQAIYDATSNILFEMTRAGVKPADPNAEARQRFDISNHLAAMRQEQQTQLNIVAQYLSFINNSTSKIRSIMSQWWNIASSSLMNPNTAGGSAAVGDTIENQIIIEGDLNVAVASPDQIPQTIESLEALAGA